MLLHESPTTSDSVASISWSNATVRPLRVYVLPLALMLLTFAFRSPMFSAVPATRPLLSP